ncbi:hypothetical protein Pla110_05590 [Polystyrenella longa]|uniref:Uncharacterized protein n=1 Tax=Polystyrenella longa TaxID=2528007 RepID=A0A518CI02_9PLAN|nr:hypothetical protein [Polystyrenella longa]QDU78855.1 hypothetical protein Pla110_05590 [Polystyrenella longa]
MKKFACILIPVVFLCGLMASNAWALATEEFGNKPQAEANYPYWDDLEKVVNHPSRHYRSRGNVFEYCYFKADVDQLNEILKKFAAVKMQKHTVEFKKGPGKGRDLLKTVEFEFSSLLKVNNGFNAYSFNDGVAKTPLNGIKLYRPEVRPDPVLTIYLSGDITRDKLKIPGNCTVEDETVTE